MSGLINPATQRNMYFLSPFPLHYQDLNILLSKGKLRDPLLELSSSEGEAEQITLFVARLKYQNTDLLSF